MTTPLLSLRGLRIDRGTRTVLHGLDLDIEPGTVVGLIGPNGSGKTTLLSALGAGTAISSGSMLCAGIDLTALRPRARARHVAFVPQHTRLDFDLTVREIVTLGTLVTGDATHRDRMVDTALRRAGCEYLSDRPATRLSGGECQLVHIARALAQHAPVLVMDEPISALDLAHQITVLTLARAHADTPPDDHRGAAVIVSLHDIDLAARYCDRLVLLHAGRIVAAGTPADVLDPNRLERVYGVPVHIHHDRTTRSLRVTAFPGPSPAGAS